MSEFQALPEGIHVYLGTTGVGKTFKALAEALETSRVTGLSLIVVDSGGAMNFEQLPHSKSLVDVVRSAWGTPGSLTVWTPPDDEGKAFDGLMKACQDAGHVILLVDEISFWAHSTRFRTLCRVWRHSHVTLLVTCQNVGTDLAQGLLACNPTLYLFRTTAPRSLEWVLRWHGIDPDEVRALPDREYIVKTF